MEYVTLADTGITVSRICLGMMSYGDPGWQGWVLDDAAGCGFVRQALDLGVTMFDTADAYSAGESEAILGRAIRSLVARNQVVVATKVGLPAGRQTGGLSPAYLHQAIDASLRRLGMDHVDLYQAHGWDPDVPVAETMGALADIVQAGKARAVGACNFAAWQLAAANRGGPVLEHHAGAAQPAASRGAAGDAALLRARTRVAAWPTARWRADVWPRPTPRGSIVGP